MELYRKPRSIRVVAKIVTGAHRLARPVVCILALLVAQACLHQVSVTTYHNDPQRTGWNSEETTLTPKSVKPPLEVTTFGHIATVPLDGQVDTQPLVVAAQGIRSHAVVYVTTENNTVYAIDSITGAILKTRHLGPPVGPFEPWGSGPYACGNNSEHVGINGTPTIDVSSRTLYVISYTNIDRTPTYRLHALDLATLTDRPGSPVTVAATQTLQDGSTYRFNATWQRQRAALLQSQDRIYAAFGSFCDWGGSDSRGWLLAWDKASLTALPARQLDNRLTPSSSVPAFLSSIWMSGYGVAADPAGNLYFTTGNTTAGTYNGTFNISESAVKMSGDLSHVISLFTPSNVNDLDGGDLDFGSGGLMVLPDGTGPRPEMRLAVAAGKDGRLFILNRDNMGGFPPPNSPQAVPIGACWCGPSYFETRGRIGLEPLRRIVSSGGNQVMLWFPTNTQIIVPPKVPSLIFAASGEIDPSDQDGGFFTSVSSNGTNPNSAIIWAVSRQLGTNHVKLYAFDATPVGGTLPLLWSGVAGDWWNTLGGANANIVPTVANGRVFVASFWQLQIFGLRPPVAESIAAGVPPAGWRQFWGTVKSSEGTRMTLELRTGRLLQVDVSSAIKEQRATPVPVGQPARVTGRMSATGIFEATTVIRARGRSLWGADREQ